MGLRSFHRAAYRNAGRYMGLYALHHDPAAGRVAVAAATALRGGGARRRSGDFRILSHHASNAGAVYHHGVAVPPARLDPAVRHHLRDDAGRSRRPPDGVSGAGLSRILSVHECGAVGGAADDPLGHHQHPVEYLHQELVAAARARTQPGLTTGRTTVEHVSLVGRIFRGTALGLILVFFMFPIVWILLMSFQTNEQILRIPPRILFEPTLANYEALISGQLRTAAG